MVKSSWSEEVEGQVEAPEPDSSEPVDTRSEEPMTWEEMKEVFRNAGQRVAEGPLVVIRNGFRTMLGAFTNAADAAAEEFEKPTLTKPSDRRDS